MSPQRFDAGNERGSNRRPPSAAPEAQPAVGSSPRSALAKRANPAKRKGAAKGAPRKVDEGLLIELIALGNTSEQAAAELGVSAKTVSRHRADPALRDAITARRAELIRDIAAKLAAHGSKAVDVLVEGMNGDDPRWRHNSAKAVLDRIVPFRLAGELEDRIIQLERATSTDVPAASEWPGEAS